MAPMVWKGSLLYFGLGCGLGLTIAMFFGHLQIITSKFQIQRDDTYTSLDHVITGHSRIIANTTAQPDVLHFEDNHLHNDDAKVAESLYKQVRVLCWVMTSPNTLESKAKHVKATWGKRCNILLFMSSITNPSFPAVGLNISEGRDHLTAKTMHAFKYVYDHYLNEADWFMKADDDTYVIVENLRYFLRDKNTDDPVYYGHKFRTIVKGGYFSGGAGYVLSREALRRWHQNRQNCRKDGGAEDVEMGKCLVNAGVTVGNSLDSFGRTRFHCFDPSTHMEGGYPNWYYNYDANGAKKDFISDYAISFHYVSPKLMYMLEFYVYHLRPFGIVSGHQQLNELSQNTHLHIEQTTVS